MWSCADTRPCRTRRVSVPSPLRCFQWHPAERWLSTQSVLAGPSSGRSGRKAAGPSSWAYAQRVPPCRMSCSVASPAAGALRPRQPPPLGFSSLPGRCLRLPSSGHSPCASPGLSLRTLRRVSLRYERSRVHRDTGLNLAQCRNRPGLGACGPRSKPAWAGAKEAPPACPSDRRSVAKRHPISGLFMRAPRVF